MAGDFEDGCFHGFEDLKIAGAAAEIARESFANLIASWMRILVQQSLRGDQYCWSAVAALRGAEISKRFLQRMQGAVCAEPFHCQHFFFVAFEREEQAGQNRFAVQQDSARPALAEFAAVFCSGVVQVFAEDLEQRLVGCEGDISLFAV